jgi:hypothetical protein
MSGLHLRERTKMREFVLGDEGRAGTTAHFHLTIVVDKVEFAQVGIAYQPDGQEEEALLDLYMHASICMRRDGV